MHSTLHNDLNACLVSLDETISTADQVRDYSVLLEVFKTECQ